MAPHRPIVLLFESRRFSKTVARFAILRLASMRVHNIISVLLLFAVSAGLICAQASVPPDVTTTLNSISPAELKGDLSFLASDVLQGRYTPSPGLEIAAEFIAAQFRAAGLEPGGNQQYFQVAAMVDRRLPSFQSEMAVQDGSNTVKIPAQSLAIEDANQAAKIDHAAVLVFAARDPELIKGKDLKGKAILAPQLSPGKIPRDQLEAVWEKARAFDAGIASSNATVEILVGDHKPWQDAKLIPAEEAALHRVPVILVTSERLHKWIQHPAASGEIRTVSLSIPAPEDHNITLKNVIGILRGSDPKLKETCVLLTAHYDHIGTTETAGRMAMAKARAGDDHIYNGANDDGSGTVSVTEIAKALARMNPRPKRSIVFMTFFGEERGDIGSQYYGKHPIFPISKTVADVNLEQIGRTDSTVGKQINSASLTGFDYSDVTKFLEDAGRATGIRVYQDKNASDEYFERSDNAALAEEGVPAHSLTVAFDFPDYHGLGDEWQKIDYENMARVDRMIALGLVNIANSTKAPEWNAQNPKTLAFRKAQAKLREDEAHAHGSSE
jgi:hypothetical protein